MEQKHLFYVGQRVSLKRDWSTPYERGACAQGEVDEGTCATVTHLPPQIRQYSSGTWYGVAIDGFVTPPKTICIARECDMQPIYDGDQKTAWSETAWMPMHMRTAKPATAKPETVETK